MTINSINLDEKTYLIKLSQLKELCSSKNQDRKYEIFADVLSCPYIEQSSGAVISKGLVKGGTAISGGLVKGVGKCFTATVEVIDRLSEPPKKGTGKS